MRNPLVLIALMILSGAVGAGLFAAARPWIGGATAASGATDGAAVRSYLLANPEVIPEALERLQARETARQVAANRGAITTAFAGAAAGAKQGDVTVAVFMDYACGFCRASLPAIAQLIATDPKVRIVYRELPVLSAQSRVAAEWALAAAEQGRYRGFHDAVFAAGQVSEGSVAAAARTAGLDLARAERVRLSPAVENELTNNLAIARQLGVSGTPAWVVGDRVLSGVQTFEGLRDAVAAARAPR